MDYVTVTVSGGKTFRRDIGAEGMSIGRSSSNDLVLEDPGVSRSHARIARFPEGFFLLDAGGKNGTFINERRIASPTLLHTGDIVRIGSSTLTFNGTSSSPVEFVDSPLAAGPATRFLRVSDAVTPTSLSSSSSGTDTEPSIRSVITAGQASSFANPALNIVFEADKELVFHRPLGEILETILDLVAKAVPFDRGLLMLKEDGRLVPRVVRVPPGEEGRTISISQTIADRVTQSQESVLTADALADERFREGHSIVAQQVRSAMCVPLWNNRDVIGIIYIDSRRRAGLFTEDHLRLLAHLANVAAVKIENVRLFEQQVQAQKVEAELARASEIQKLLLPAQSPPIPGYLLHGSSEPARVVGGDLFDYIDLPGGRWVLALGDVAGKGYPAALLMTAFQATLRALAELDLPPAETIDRLNRLLFRRFPDNRFVTFFYGVLDPAANTLTYVNAGHCPPYLLKSNGQSEELGVTGGPLGMFEKGDFEAKVVDIESGSLFVCYSDGVTEVSNPEGELFGEDNLLALIKTLKGATPSDIIEKITSVIAVHHQNAPPDDDITLVVLKRT